MKRKHVPQIHSPSVQWLVVGPTLKPARCPHSRFRMNDLPVRIFPAHTARKHPYERTARDLDHHTDPVRTNKADDHDAARNGLQHASCLLADLELLTTARLQGQEGQGLVAVRIRPGRAIRTISTVPSACTRSTTRSSSGNIHTNVGGMRGLRRAHFWCVPLRGSRECGCYCRTIGKCTQLHALGTQPRARGLRTGGGHSSGGRRCKLDMAHGAQAGYTTAAVGTEKFEQFETWQHCSFAAAGTAVCGTMSKTPEAEEGYVTFARLDEEIAG